MFLAMQSFLKDKSNVAVLIRLNNRTAIAYLNKMGSPIQSQLCLLALEIWEWCLRHQISPHAEYLAGKGFSRLGISSPWQQQLATPAISFRSYLQSAESFYSRPLCEQDESPAARLLQLETRTPGESCRCIFSIMVTRTALPLPFLQHDWEGTFEDLLRRSRLCLLDSSSLASSGVVRPGTENVSGESSVASHGAGSPLESRPEASSFSPREPDVFNRMACLRQAFST